MKKHILLLIVVTGIIFASCNNSRHSNPDQRQAEIEKQVLDQWELITAAVEKADAANYATFISTDQFISMFSGGMAFYTRQAYVDSVNAWFGSRKGAGLNEKKITLKILDDNTVLLDQYSVLTTILKDNKAPAFYHVVSFIFRKEEPGWKIIHGHESWRPLD